MVSPDYPSNPITSGVILEQFIRSKSSNFNGVDIVFGTYNRTNHSTLIFEIYEVTPKTRDLIHSQEVNAINLKDNKPYQIRFAPHVNSLNKTYSVVIKSNANAQNCVCCWISRETKDFSYYLDTGTQLKGNLLIEPRYIPLSERTKDFGNKSVDIVVCVYNQPQYVKGCLDSIIKNTFYPNYQVIIVDDGSNEETVKLLKQYEQRPNFKLISKKNEGYVKSANYGMKSSSADYCVLLNSDTEVTEGWLTKAVIAGELKPQAGILGLLSNNATWQSLPTNNLGFGKYPDIPYPYTLSQFALLVDALSNKNYPETSHVHGSCYIIKREVFQSIGYFDDINFEKGYLEEDDYSLRAAQAGFKLIWVDNAFYYHHGRKTFTPEKRKKLIDKNRPYYDKKWGEIDRENIYNLKHYNPILYLKKKLKNFYENKLKEIKTLKIGYVLSPSGRAGGVISVLQILHTLKALGFENVELFHHVNSTPNLKLFPEFNINYTTYHKITDKKYDAVIGTLNTTINKYLIPYIAKYPQTLPAYFIQDFEPYFYSDQTGFNKALQSYTAIKRIIGLAKTYWICNIVEARSGLKVIKTQPGLSHKEYMRDDKPKVRDKYQVVAMLRPQTPRRNALVTFKALQKLKNHFGNKLRVITFGAHHQTLIDAGINLPTDDWEHLGITNAHKLNEVFNRSHLFIDGSTYQAFGRTALEAMACGCVPLVPRYGGCSEFSVDGFNSFRVEPTTKSIFETCVKALKSDLSQLSENAVQTANQYDLKTEALQHLQSLEFYKTLQSNYIALNNHMSDLIKDSRVPHTRAKDIKIGNQIVAYNNIYTYAINTKFESFISNVVNKNFTTYLKPYKSNSSSFKADLKGIIYVHYNDVFYKNQIKPLIEKFKLKLYVIECSNFKFSPRELEIINSNDLPQVVKEAQIVVNPDFLVENSIDYDLDITSNNCCLLTSNKLPIGQSGETYIHLKDANDCRLKLHDLILHPQKVQQISNRAYERTTHYHHTQIMKRRLLDYIKVFLDLKHA